MPKATKIYLILIKSITGIEYKLEFDDSEDRQKAFTSMREKMTNGGTLFVRKDLFMNMKYIISIEREHDYK